MARFCPLFSGSSGNCTYIGSSSGGVLVDVGVSARRIELALWDRGIDPRSIGAVFITHEHSDHISGLRVLCKKYGYRVYASAGTLGALIDANTLDVYGVPDTMPEQGVEVADMLVTAFRTSHDSRESMGYRIHLPDDRRVAVATDTGLITDDTRQALTGCDLVLLESNHDVHMLENGPYPYYLKRRILASTGHLSNEACARELPALAERGTARFFLGHLSKENNLPQLAYETSRLSLTEAGLREGIDYTLTVAPRDSTAEMTVF
ncbi:MAG: MBL fold metallo-hydrolase [Clostridiales bacterium]|jgi:phosphoribosyl 1,2-cyclic phosphodiesterase|nr:MBL fold metallo-hydrolase [Clostridiales bacterium]